MWKLQRRDIIQQLAVQVTSPPGLICLWNIFGAPCTFQVGGVVSRLVMLALDLFYYVPLDFPHQ